MYILSDIIFRVAIVLAKPYFYTNYVKQMKGENQFKKRHLEILGYTVVFLDFAEWKRLQNGKQKIEFLKDSIWPKTTIKTYSVIER